MVVFWFWVVFKFLIAWFVLGDIWSMLKWMWQTTLGWSDHEGTLYEVVKQHKTYTFSENTCTITVTNSLNDLKSCALANQVILTISIAIIWKIMSIVFFLNIFMTVNWENAYFVTFKLGCISPIKLHISSWILIPPAKCCLIFLKTLVLNTNWSPKLITKGEHFVS